MSEIKKETVQMVLDLVVKVGVPTVQAFIASHNKEIITVDDWKAITDGLVEGDDFWDKSK